MKAISETKKKPMPLPRKKKEYTLNLLENSCPAISVVLPKPELKDFFPELLMKEISEKYKAKFYRVADKDIDFGIKLVERDEETNEGGVEEG